VKLITSTLYTHTHTHTHILYMCTVYSIKKRNVPRVFTGYNYLNLF